MKQIPEIEKRYWLDIHQGNINSISSTDIATGCPHCREGNSWGRKFRLHLYIKDSYSNTHVKCWNCGLSHTFYNYLKEYYPTQYTRYQQEQKLIFIENLKEEHKNKKKSATKKTEEDLSWLDDIKEVSEIEENKETKKENHSDILKQFNKDFPKSLINFLNKRGIELNDKEWFFNPYKREPLKINQKMIFSNSLIIPFYDEDKNLKGLQSILFNGKKGYQNHVFEDHWKVWNWDKIDKQKPVYIFESIFDALSSGFTNIISSLGLYLDGVRLKELKEPVFVLDNQNIDRPSLKRSKELAKQGYKVFIWDKKIPLRIKDINDMLKYKIPKEQIKKIIKSGINQGLECQIKLNLIDN